MLEIQGVEIEIVTGQIFLSFLIQTAFLTSMCLYVCTHVGTLYTPKYYFVPRFLNND